MKGNDLDELAEAEQEPPGLREFVYMIVSEYKWVIIGVIILIIARLINPFAWIDVVPNEFWIYWQWFLYGGLISFIPVRKVVEWLQSKDLNPLVVLNIEADPEELDEPKLDDFQIWNLGDYTYRDMKEIKTVYNVAGVDIAVDYDPADNVATGTWLSELSEAKLMVFKHLLWDTRQKLVQEASEGIAAKASRKTDSLKTQRINIKAILRQMMSMGVIGADDIEQAIEQMDADTSLAKEIAEMSGDETQRQRSRAKAEEIKDEILEGETNE